MSDTVPGYSISEKELLSSLDNILILSTHHTPQHIRGCPRLMRQLDTYCDGEHSWQSTGPKKKKMKIPSRWPFRNWLILNGQRAGIFFFFFLRAGGLPRVLEGLGWWWSPRLWARPSKKTWRREAICLSVQVLNISVLLYTVYLSFNAHSVTHSAIIWQYWVKIL